MFQECTSFNGNISNWNISNVTNLTNFLYGGKLSRENYDALLLGWSTLDAGETQIPTGLNAHFGSSKYSNTSTVVTARDTELISNKGWTITDGGIDSDFTLPLIVSNSLALDNTTISVTFSEVVYRTNVGSGALEITDFLYGITGGTATLSSTTPTSITSSDNLTFVLGIGLTGTPNGSEILTVTPVLNAVFDASGNVASTTQTNNTAQLHDLSVPIITGPNGALGLTSVLSFNENQTTVFGFTADKAVSWSLGSSNDEALFALDASGTLVFNSAPDFETPLSSTSSNTYLVEVIATDSSSNVSTQTLTITIVDVAAAAFTTFSPITKTFFDDPYLITSPVSSNTSSITFTSSNTAVATVSGTTVTITGIGTAIITAAQAADATYDDNTTTATLTVVGISVLTKNGTVSNTDPTYVDKYGRVGGATGLSANGILLQAKTPVPLQNSLRIDAASSQYLTFTKPSSLNASGDFTFETWIKFNTIQAGIMDPIFGGGQNDYLSIYGGNFAARINVNSPCGGDRNFFPSSNLIVGSWHHIAVVRSGSTITAYLDGVAKGTTSCTGTFMNSLSTVYIGKNSWRSGYLNASISNMRYVVGTAVYTANFTPPKSVLTAISGTQFLFLANDVNFPLKDSGPNNITVNAIGGSTLTLGDGPF